MKAFTKKIYGGPEVLKLEEVAKPDILENEILVKVVANSANPADWHILRGSPILARFALGLFKPKYPILGADFSGIIEQVGESVTAFSVGDKVIGESLKGGAFAEFINVDSNYCAKVPEDLDLNELACLPLAGITAFQAVIKYGKLKANESVLINGASGGVGHFAIQLAKSKGANVTGVCSSRNKDFVLSLGADEVICYDKQDIHSLKTKFDLVIDINGNLLFSDYKRMGDRGVMIGFVSMKNMIGTLIRSKFSKFPLEQFTAEPTTADLEELVQVMSLGSLKVHVDKRYNFSQIPEAIAYIEKMRTRGKVCISH